MVGICGVQIVGICAVLIVVLIVVFVQGRYHVSQYFVFQRVIQPLKEYISFI